MGKHSLAAVVGMLACLVGPVGAQDGYNTPESVASAHEKQAEWHQDLDVTLSHDDNQSQAWRSRDRVEDNSLSVRQDVSLAKPFGFQHMITTGFFVGGQVHEAVNPVERATLGARVAWRSAHNNAFTAPLFEWSLSTQYDNYRDEPRDSRVDQVQFFVTRRFTDRITTTLGGDYQWRHSNGSVFDLERSRAFFNLDYRAYGDKSVYLTASRADGEVFSSAQRSFCDGSTAWDILPLVNAATAIEPDEAYNETFCGDWIAYRLDAISNVGVLGVNWPLSNKMSLDVSALRAEVFGSRDVDYERNIYRASLLKRF